MEYGSRKGKIKERLEGIIVKRRSRRKGKKRIMNIFGIIGGGFEFRVVEVIME